VSHKNYFYSNRKYLAKSLIWILSIILLGSIMVYGLNSQVSRTSYFIFLIFFLLLSKNNVLGVAIFFILAFHPWGLLYSAPYNWVVPVTQTFGISYDILLGLIFIFKLIFSRYWRRNMIIDFFKPYYLWFVIYLVFLVFLGLIHGYNIRSYYDLFLSLVTYSLLFIFVRIFNYERAYQFNTIIFAFCLILTSVSLLDVALQGKIFNLLTFGRRTRTLLITDDNIVRLFGGIQIAFYSFIVAIYYLVSAKASFKRLYLWVVILASMLLILNTGTRGWIIATFFIFIISMIIYAKKAVINPEILFSGLFIIIIIFMLLPSSILRNISGSFKRLETLEAVVQGDMTAGGTARRWDTRGPGVLSRFNESPIFGFGFSKVSSEYYDHHVGNHTLLLTSGIVGLVIVWLTILSIIIFIYKLEKKGYYYEGIFVFGIAFMAIMIIHSTNEVMISYIGMRIESGLLLALLLNQLNAHVYRLRYSSFRFENIKHI